MPLIDVILCTHNPHPDLLRQTLVALASQTLPRDQWQLWIVDNASDPSVANILDKIDDLSPDMRPSIINEPRPGLTLARLAGITGTESPLLVFVDDDNVLAPDYLANVGALFRKHQSLGSIGGAAYPIFAREPGMLQRQFLPCLALREVRVARSSAVFDWNTVPYGAGLAVLRTVAVAYSNLLQKRAPTKMLDRRGGSLLSAGDIDLAMTAHDLDLGCGLFPELRLGHIIPASRLRLGYLFRLAIMQGVSSVLLMRQRRMPIKTFRFMVFAIAAAGYRLFRLDLRMSFYFSGQLIGLLYYTPSRQ